MSIHIQKGVSESQRIGIAKIFYESFQEKFGQIFGDSKKAIKLISALLQEDRILAAIKDEQVAGFVGLDYQEKKFMKKLDLKRLKIRKSLIHLVFSQDLAL